jgi:uncharacterized protein
MTKAWMQTLTGRALAMANPSPRDIDLLTDVPEGLARITRYNGAVPAGLYSVAQHCVIVADAILDERGDAELAAHGLLHDAHEFMWGDITTPQLDGLAEIAAESYPDIPADAIIRGAINVAKRRADLAIYAAAGMPLPSPHQVRVVKAYDLRALVTERNHMLSPSVKSWGAVVERAEPLRMRGSIRPWPIAQAADAFRERLLQLCPAVSRRANGKGN